MLERCKPSDKERLVGGYFDSGCQDQFFTFTLLIGRMI